MHLKLQAQHWAQVEASDPNWHKLINGDDIVNSDDENEDEDEETTDAPQSSNNNGNNNNDNHQPVVASRILLGIFLTYSSHNFYQMHKYNHKTIKHLAKRRREKVR